jgi:predicted TIM-barrel fold metal-dependent hydrolase
MAWRVKHWAIPAIAGVIALVWWQLRSPAGETLSAPTPMAVSKMSIVAQSPETKPVEFEFHDSHFHLTNYVQRGITIEKYLEIMGNQVGRSTLFGIPLQQTWYHPNSGNFGPQYYTETDAPLYYYSFTDAFIAKQYLDLPAEKRVRFDPMITGFNPADMYAAEHIERVLRLFPGVFTGIGEFTIHKELVSSKVAGPVASLTNPALDRIFKFCAESGLLIIIHNDIDMPFGRPGIVEPIYLAQMKDLLRRNQKTPIIWAHTGLGRIVQPYGFNSTPAQRSPDHLSFIEAILADRDLSHVYFDISWDEVAKYVIARPETIKATADLLNKYPDRFLYGSDEVAPKDREAYLKTYNLYEPLWALLTPETTAKVRKGNYERLFDAARTKVRAWEAANLPGSR